MVFASGRLEVVLETVVSWGCSGYEEVERVYVVKARCLRRAFGGMPFMRSW